MQGNTKLKLSKTLHKNTKITPYSVAGKYQPQTFKNSPGKHQAQTFLKINSMNLSKTN
jgi:hypothetical protein